MQITLSRQSPPTIRRRITPFPIPLHLRRFCLLSLKLAPLQVRDGAASPGQLYSTPQQDARTSTASHRSHKQNPTPAGRTTPKDIAAKIPNQRGQHKKLRFQRPIRSNPSNSANQTISRALQPLLLKQRTTSRREEFQHQLAPSSQQSERLISPPHTPQHILPALSSLWATLKALIYIVILL